jgi:hypothetical protein
VTVFVVGQDAALAKNAGALRRIADAGHEIANHSFAHEPWIHTYSYQQADQEIAAADAAIEQATGQRPRGFRGPGFSVSSDVLRVLAERKYLYDASTFPTFVGPLARAYYFWGSRNLSKEERDRRKELFGTLKDGLRDVRPYILSPETTANGKSPRPWVETGGAHEAPLVEIPVTTMPLFRLPIHMSYIGYLAGHSRLLARAYLKSSIALLKGAGMDLSFLLHPLDFLGKDKEDRLRFFPGMQMTTDHKLELLDEALASITRAFQPVTMREHARVLLDGGRLRTAPLS